MKHSMTRFTSFLLALIMLFSVAVFPVSAANAYTDVPSDAWYKGAVDYVTEKEIMNGVTEDTFEPGAVVTRAMFVTVLSRLAKAETDNTVSPFADVPAGQWYTGAVAWAAEHGIVNGVGDNLFAPNNSITRQDMCTVLARFVNAMGYELPQDQTVTFKDIRQVASYARDAVKFCAAAGLIAGYEDGRFAPKDTTTRAEIATVMMRFDMLLDGQIVEPIPMPAQSFDGTAGEDMTVAVNAPEGALPENTNMTVSRVTDEALLADIAEQIDGQVYAAADITFSKDGAELEPEKNVEVQISLDGLENLKNPTVYHVNADGSVDYVAAEVVSATRGSEKVLRFYASEFSVYAIGDSGSTVKTLTVNFYDKAGEIVSSQVIRLDQLDQYIAKNMDFVHDPGVPTITDTQSFEGWADNQAYTEEDTGYSVADINEKIKTEKAALAAATADQTWNYYAKVYEVVFVTFHDQGGVVIRLESIHLDEATHEGEYEVNLSYSPFKGGWAHIGWTPVINNTGNSPTYPENPVVYENGDTITLTASIDLYPYLKEGYWLVFENYIDQDLDDTSASFTQPKYYGKDETVSEPTDYGDANNDGVDHDTAPYRVGYTFGGWYDSYTTKQATTPDGTPLYVGLKGELTTETTQVDEETGETKTLEPREIVDTWGPEHTWDTKLTEETKVYAKWIPDESSYLVVFMMQNAKDAYDSDVTNNTYTYYDSVRRDWTWENGAKRDSVAGDIVTAFTASSVTVNDTYLATGDLTEGTYYGKTVSSLGKYFQYSTGKNAGKYVMVDGDGSTVLFVYYDLKPLTINFYEPNLSSSAVSGSSIYNNTSRQYFYKSGSEYYSLHYSTVTISGNSYHHWSATTSSGTVSYYCRSGSWYQPDSDGYLQSVSSPSFYYVTGNTLIKSCVGLYGHTAESGEFPSLESGKGWYWNGYTTHAETTPGSYSVYDSYDKSYDSSPSDYVVNYYKAAYAAATNTKTAHKISQNPETGEWGVEYDTTTVDDVYIRIFEDETGRTVYGFNNYTNSMSSSNHFQSRPSSGIVLLGYNPDGGNTTSGSTWYGIQEEDGYVYYKLKEHNLVFRSKTGVVKEETLRYSQSFEKYGHVDNDLTKEDFVPTDGGMGYYFVGWYTDESYLTPFDFSGTMPDHPVTVYAKWEKMRFRVVLDYTGGDTSAEVEFPANQASTFRVDYGEKVRDSAIMAATREGYTLLGWYLDTNGEHPFNFGEAITDETYSMDKTYVFGTGRTGTDPVTGKTYDDDALDAEGNPRYGNVIGKLTIYALWRQNSVGSDGIRVRYDAIEDDGYFPVDGEATDPRVIIRDDPNVYTDHAKAFVQVASTPEDDENYRFLYWVVMQPVKDAQGNVVMENGKPKLEPTQIKVYPGQTFTVDYNYTVKTDAFKITWNYKDSTGAQWLHDVTTVTAGAMPVHSEPSGYISGNLYYPFDHWDPTVAEATANTAYTAVYGDGQEIANMKFNVTWKNYDGTVLKTEKVQAGSTPSYTDETPTKPSDSDYNYTFSGWDPTPAPISGDMTYTATYSASPRLYTITFNANGGSSTTTVDNVAKDTLWRDIFPSTNPTHSSYTFLGWFTEATGGTEVQGTDAFDGTRTEVFAHYYQLQVKKDTSGELEDGEVYVFRMTSGSTNYYMNNSSNTNRLTRTSTSPIPTTAQWKAVASTSTGLYLESVSNSGYRIHDYSSDDDYPATNNSTYYRFLLKTASSTDGTFYLYTPGNDYDWYIYWDGNYFHWSNSTSNRQAFTVMKRTMVDMNAGSKGATIGDVALDGSEPSATRSAAVVFGSDVQKVGGPTRAAVGDYRLVTAPENGKKYLLAYVENSTTYVVTTTYYNTTNKYQPKISPVTVSSNGDGSYSITSSNITLSEMLLQAEANGEYWRFNNAAKGYFCTRSDGYATYSNDTTSPVYDWTVSSGKLTSTNTSDYIYLYATTVSGYWNTEYYDVDCTGTQANASTFLFYELIESTGPCTVTYMVNGTQSSSFEVDSGSSVTLPSTATAVAGYSFIGWTDAAITEETAVKPTVYEPGSSKTITSDKTFYALYSRVDESEPETVYELLTAAPTDWAGNYVVTNNATSTSGMYVLNGVSGSASGTTFENANNRSDFDSTDITLDGSTMSNVANNYVVTLAANGSYYTVKSASTGAYYGMNSSSYLTAYTSINSTYCNWTPGINASGLVQLKNAANGSYPYFSWSADNNYFWSGSSSNANVLKLWKETVVYATYYTTNAVTTHQITWKYMNAEGTLQTVSVDVPEGTTPEAPTVSQTYTADGTIYRFTGWDKTIAEVTGPETYTAQYEVSKYIITWNYKKANGDDTSTTTEVDPNAVPKKPTIPSSYTSGSVTWYFKGWNSEPAAATGPATYTAQYTSTAYTITWHIQIDGGAWTAVETTVAEGVVPTYNSHPIWTDNAGDDWQFSGWSTSENGEVLASLPAATEDTAYYAKYTKVGVYTYTMYLYAVYGMYNKFGTHVTWFGNNDPTEATAGVQIERDKGMQINIGYPIPKPDAFVNGVKDYAGDSTQSNPTTTTLTYVGHTFLGWARLEADPNDTANAGSAHPDLTEADLYLKWDADSGKYYLNTNAGNAGAPVWSDDLYTNIAADEMTPYHDMYAVWGPGSFFIFHSATGKLEAVSTSAVKNSASGTIDLTEHVTPGYLYGGYYLEKTTDAGSTSTTLPAYGYIKPAEMAAIVRNYETGTVSWTSLTAVEADDPVAVHTITASEITGFTTYDGSARYTNGLTTAYSKDAKGNIIKDSEGHVILSPAIWDKKAAATADDGAGTAVVPVPGKVYYLKEVPSSYLTSKVLYTYNFGTGAIQDIWTVTAVDDGNYSSVGFQSVSGKNASGVSSAELTASDVVSASFTLMTENFGDGTPAPVKVDATSFGLSAGYVAVSRRTDLVNEGRPSFSMLPGWTTLDGVKVNNNALYWNYVDHSQDDPMPEDWMKHQLSWNRLYDGTEKLYIDMSKGQGVGDGWTTNAVIQVMFLESKPEGQTWGNSGYITMKPTGDGSIYEVTVPKGNWNLFVIFRKNGSNTDQIWNQTGNIPFNNDLVADPHQGSSNVTSNGNIITYFTADSNNNNFHVVWGHYPS